MREFWGLDFEIGPQTLDPRPDTETLVSAALQVAREGGSANQLNLLDLGTGSGCVLVSLLHELEHATGLGTDRSIEALEFARANAIRHAVEQRVQFLCASWHEGLSCSFGMVVSNPPYIPADDLVKLEPEVALYDPRAALDGGRDGLEAYQKIMSTLQALLAPGGWILFEVGDGQAQAVSDMFQDMSLDLSFDEVRQWNDIAGRVRCVAAKRSPTM
jgi:release factor glutamine methyltransferase